MKMPKNFDKATEEEMKDDGIYSRSGRKPKWPFSSMEVGDFVEVKLGQYGGWQSPQDYALKHAYETGKKFRTKKVNRNTYHIWRIA